MFKEMRQYTQSMLNDLWVDTMFEGYKYLDPKQKGSFGETFLDLAMTETGHDIESRINDGHDSIVDTIKTEYKFGLSHTDNKKQEIKVDVFSFNHVGEHKDWERLILCGVNYHKDLIDCDDINIILPYCRIMWMTKSDFSQSILYEGKYWNRQQGGKKGGNDDWFSMDKKPLALYGSRFVSRIVDW